MSISGNSSEILHCGNVLLWECSIGLLHAGNLQKCGICSANVSDKAVIVIPLITFPSVAVYLTSFASSIQLSCPSALFGTCTAHRSMPTGPVRIPFHLQKLSSLLPPIQYNLFWLQTESGNESVDETTAHAICYAFSAKLVRS